MAIDPARLRAAATAAGSENTYGVKRRDEPETVLVSATQRHLWAAHRLDPTGRSNTIAGAIDLRGDLDTSLLETALHHVVEQHEALRTRLGEDDGKLVTKLDSSRFVLRRHDIATHSDPIGEADRLAASLVAEPFSTANFGELLRVALIRIGQQHHRLVMSVHHAIADGIAVGLVMRELAAAYGTLIEGGSLHVDDHRLQYGDVVAWQSEATTNIDDVAWWHSYLNEAVCGGSAPTDRPRSRRTSHDGDHLTASLGSRLRRDVDYYARGRNLTPFSVLLAVFRIWTHRLIQTDDVLIGLPLANRGHGGDLSAVVGPLLNILPFRSTYHNGTSFAELVDETAEQLPQLLARQHIAATVATANLEATPGRSAWPVMFTFLGEDRSSFRLPGLRATPVGIETATAKVDLTLSVATRGDDYELQLEYATDLFERATAKSLLAAYRTLLSRALEDDDHLVTSIPMSRPSTTVPEVVEPVADPVSLVDAWQRSVVAHRDLIALTWEGGSLTYGQLATRVDRLASCLDSMGVGRGDRVALSIERGPAQVVAILAVLRAGAGYVPIDKRHPTRRAEAIVEDSSARALITDSQQDANVPSLQIDFEGTPTNHYSTANEAVNSTVALDDLAYVIYTSGSTGRPKGVEITHQNVLRLFSASRSFYDFNNHDVWTMFHSYAFDVSVWEMWGAFLHGGRLVVLDTAATLAPNKLRQILIDEAVTVLCETPTAFRGMITADAERPASELMNLRYIIFAGEPLDVGMLKPWLDRHREQATLVNMYGITETCVHSTYQKITLAEADRPVAPIGSPISDVELHLLDDGMNPVPQGFYGEIYIGGPSVARGYMAKPGLTAERFVPDPFSRHPGRRLYRSGDLGRRRGDGLLECWGRADNQVKIRGFRVELGEVEVALADHGAVRHAVAAIRNGQLVAHVVPAAPSLNTEELRAHCRETLPDYAVPAVVYAIDSMPTTANGKIDRTALPDPNSHREAARGRHVEPSNEIEAAVAAAIGDALDVANVSMSDNFFTLGGDSIRALEVVARLKQSEIHVDVLDIFDTSDAAELARRARRTYMPTTSIRPFELLSETDASAATEAGASDAYPLTATQAGMIYEAASAPGSGLFHNTVSVRLRGSFDQYRFHKAVTGTIAAHAVLRTSIALAGYSEPIQLVWHAADTPVEVMDLRDRSTESQGLIIERHVKAERAAAFKLDHAPLFRLTVHLLKDDEFQCTVSEHHAILDGWSWTSTFAEIFSRHAALVADDEEMLQSLDKQPEVQFADFVKLELDCTQDAAQRNFWTGELSDVKSRTIADLRGRGRPSIRRQQVKIEADTSRRLRQIAADHQLPIKAVAAAVHFYVFGRLWSTSRPMTGMSFNGRPEQAGGQDVRGLFLNMLPTVVDVAADSWLELATAALAAERRILPYRRFPLPHIHRLVGAQELFDVAFNFVDFHRIGDLLKFGAVELIAEHTRSTEDTGYALLATYSMHPPSNELGLVLAYDRERVTHERVQQISRLYETALQSLAADPTASPLTPPDPQAMALLREISDGGSGPDMVHTGLDYAVMAAIEAGPAERIVIDAPDGRTDAAGLAAESGRLANQLTEVGIGAGDIVAIGVSRSRHLISAILGVLRSGAAYVPVDPGWPADRVAEVLADAGCAAWVETDDTLPTRPTIAMPTYHAEPFRVCQMSTDVSGSYYQGADRPAYLIYTSGTTGVPKGVMVRHCDALAFLSDWSAVCRIEPDDVVGALSSVAFDASILEIFGALAAGARVALAPSRLAGDSQQLHDWLHRSEVTVTFLTPTAAYPLAMADAAAAHPLRLRTLIIGGEALKPGGLGELADTLTENGCRLFNLYGPSETTVSVTGTYLDEGERHCSAVSIGRPYPGVTAWVLDESMRAVEPGAIGELYIGGRQVSAGYWRRPMLTAERFVPDPFNPVPGSRLYRSGDQVRHRADGQLEFLGRTDEQVKVRGYRIELGEVEAVLAGDKSVGQAVVEVRTGQLVAYVVPKQRPIDIHDLAARCRQLLPDYAVPSSITAIDAIPLTVSGKLDREALPAPDNGVERSGTANLKPRNPMETSILELWRELLDRDDIGIEDHFFAAGGHSLLSSQLVIAIHRRFGVQIPLREIMDDFTVAGTARIVDAALAARVALLDDRQISELLANAELDASVDGASDDGKTGD